MGAAVLGDDRVRKSAPAPPVLSTLLSGILAYWKYEESSGNRADSTGNGNTQIENGGPINSAAGIIGNAANLTGGAGQWFTVADNSSVRWTANGTLAFWFKDTIATQTNKLLASKMTGAGSGEFQLYQMDASGNLHYDVRNAAATVLGTIQPTGMPLLNNSWNLVVITLDVTNSLIGISVNNATFQTAALTSAPPSSANSFTVGAYSDGTSFITGFVDEMGKWNRVLTASEISTLWNGGAGRTYPFTGAP